MEVSRIYDLVVCNVLPDILIRVTWNVIASQLLRANYGVSLTNATEQHPAFEAFAKALIISQH
jgi:hypothetical protein